MVPAIDNDQSKRRGADRLRVEELLVEDAALADGPVPPVCIGGDAGVGGAVGDHQAPCGVERHA